MKPVTILVDLEWCDQESETAQNDEEGSEDELRSEEEQGSEIDSAGAENYKAELGGNAEVESDLSGSAAAESDLSGSAEVATATREIGGTAEMGRIAAEVGRSAIEGRAIRSPAWLSDYVVDSWKMAIKSVGGSLVSKIVELLAEPVKKQFRYMFCFNNFVQEFNEQVMSLTMALYRLQDAIDVAKRNAEEIESEWK
ncbi:hypothetical protein SADUNF_Sadunf16G0288300 [Salix dunnii]|uniref:Uncharacterized protein n=1 Tax=Salix dunnii TaxID=1413687 RepID=A0A835MKB7_9ROSI|nr:hypothetical protein SADUNF_Sadunf16G0288300 [Salix dunnii]